MLVQAEVHQRASEVLTCRCLLDEECPILKGCDPPHFGSLRDVRNPQGEKREELESHGIWGTSTNTRGKAADVLAHLR
jgi:hypothetical protein